MSRLGSLEGDVRPREARAPLADGARELRVRGALVVVASGLLSVVGVAASFAADAPLETRLRYALMNALIIFVPIGVGLYAIQREAQRRFGCLLIAAALMWSSAGLAETQAAVPYSVGRIGGWLVSVVLVWLVLAYPRGELATRLDRRLAAAALALLCVLYLPTAVLVESYPTPTPWSSCRANCPANAFMLVGQEPGFLEAWIYPVREMILVLIFVGVIAAVGARMRRATYVRRRMLSPVLAVAVAQILLYVAFLVARRSGVNASVVATLGWLVGLCVAGVALGFLAGLVRWRLYVARALQRLAVATGREMSPGELQTTLSRALADPSLRLALHRDKVWIDPAGKAIAAPAPGPRQSLTELRTEHGVVAALVHDTALDDDREFVAAVAACTLAVLERERLQATVTAGLREFEHSSALVLAQADDERRRLERDLHDGAQQRLVALAIRLELARENLATDDGNSATLKALGAEVEMALDEIRSLSRGIHPSLLADRGLAAALQAAAARSPLPAHVDAGENVGRYRDDIESAVYFTCLEALQNATKHATAATGVWITLRLDDRLGFEIRDDGAGFDQRAINPGSGLTSMRDRIAEVEGTLTIRSAPKLGTRIRGAVPLAGPLE